MGGPLLGPRRIGGDTRRRRARRDGHRDPARLVELVLRAAGLHGHPAHQVRGRPVLQGPQRGGRHPRPQGTHDLLRRRLSPPGRRGQHQEARGAGRDLRGDRAPGLPARGSDARLHRAEQGTAALPVPELDGDAQPEVRLQRPRAERPTVAHDDRPPGRPAEVQALRRPLPGRRVRQVVPRSLRAGPRPPRAQAGGNRAREARRHRRERPDRQAPGRQA